jgi:prepilin-type N-terminal cleavage/methylation domain-containing protein
MEKAFTLIELVVVVTIVGVLAIFGFISYSSYAIEARDTARVTDLKTIAKTLEYFEIEHNSYPLPSSSTGITFS